MLSGRRAFEKSTASETMASVLNDEPPELPQSSVAPALSQITRRCLEKLPEHRFQNASDLAFAFETLTGSAVSTPFQAKPPSRRHFKIVLAAASAIVGVALLGFLGGRSSRSSSAPPVIDWRGERLDGPLVAMIPRVSPDGKELAFTTMVKGQTQLALMNIATGEWHILTTNRDRGLVGYLSWSTSGDQIYYDRMTGTPNGVYRISRVRWGKSASSSLAPSLPK